MGLTAHGDDPGVTNSVKLGVGTIGTNAKYMHEGPDRKRLNRPLMDGHSLRIDSVCEPNKH